MTSYSGDYAEHYMQRSVRDAGYDSDSHTLDNTTEHLTNKKKISLVSNSGTRRSAEYPIKDLVIHSNNSVIDSEDHTTDEELFKLSTSSDDTIDVVTSGTLTSPDFYDSFEDEDERSYISNKANKSTHISSYPEVKKKQQPSKLSSTDNDLKVPKPKKTKRLNTNNKPRNRQKR
eukprot:TRINITY_DN4127_c0_g1_i1.p1 TRINITY_DN4127_c0_g1~~TRINITY_DN4127_c0_g1_i1.p1  ORF type:complete len:174 (-),score=24.73 TRINITY_DN4127_c0_g1_i1:33-554(-)